MHEYPRNPTFDSVSQSRVNALAGFAFTPRQQEFLVTVMVHAGCFLERQVPARSLVRRAAKTVPRGQRADAENDPGHDAARGEMDERETGDSHTAAHVLFAPADARRAGASHPGTRGSSGPRDDAAVHALEPGGARRRHPSAGRRRRKTVEESWRRRERRAEPPVLIEETWWRRRDLHPGPKIHPRRNLRCVSASKLSLLT